MAGAGFSTGAAWGDYDRDGRVDLYVSRYVQFDMDHLPTFGSDEKNCRFKGILVQCGPWGMIGESDLLFTIAVMGPLKKFPKSRDGRLHRYYGLGVIWGDYDNDGWPDLYVANDAGPNYLYHNKHDGTLKKSECSPALRSAATARRKAPWGWIGATICMKAGCPCS